jgi:hypothetical protein
LLQLYATEAAVAGFANVKQHLLLGVLLDGVREVVLQEVAGKRKAEAR